ncbi:MAG: hypothetical protein JNG90_06475 [Planctomycetaceae bacterium]|nr:hypothetical protein [Planctomycetaceae bacterium]
MAPALAGQLGRVDCRLVGGRIKVGAKNIGGQMQSTFRGSGRVQESFALDLTTVWPKLVYQALGSEFEIRLAVSAGEQVSIHRAPQPMVAGTRAAFRQQADGGVEFTWSDGTQSVSLAGHTLWHLWLADPDLCARELLPLLRLLHPSWAFDKQGAAVERALLAAAEQNWTDRWPRWNELVDQLGDDEYSRRRAADQALRNAGLAVVPFLQNLDREDLEPEQRSRVRRIVASLKRFNEEDTAARAALWLAGDPTIWLVLLGREQPELRRAAARELPEILGRPIDFDPDADAATRAGQLARLRAELTPAAEPAADEARS